jgi:hypothetical protein|tara:strand:+ start:2286 stop:2693 length:408 start_codon:yes stop_codon:yes gene_type:complete
MARRKEGQNQITKGRTMTKTKKTDTNKTNNKLNKQGEQFVHQFHEFVDLHGEDRTLTIIQDLHKAGHIEFKDSKLDYITFMYTEDDSKEGKPIKTHNSFENELARFMDNFYTPVSKSRPFTYGLDKSDIKKKLDS